METKANYTIVGIFIIFLISAIVLAIIWLSSGLTFENYEDYAINMHESVNGLNIDSPVEFNGVNVGTVRSIRIDKQNPQQVQLMVSVKNSTPITRGTTATLNTRGVTGTSYVALQDKSTDLHPLEVKSGQDYPVIPSVPSLFKRLDAALSELSTNFNQLGKTFSSVLDEENQQSIKATLTSLRQVTEMFAKNNQKFAAILENTSQATKQFYPLIRSTSTTFHTIETQTLPATYELLSNLQEITRSLADITKDIKQNPSILIRGVERKPLGPGER